jgi:tetratricopeptide (TPR) repeat protein
MEYIVLWCGSEGDMRFRFVDPHLDSDGDGLLDDWETGVADLNNDGQIDTTNDINLSALEPTNPPSPQRKDVYLEIDWMDCSLGGCASGDTHNHRLRDLNGNGVPDVQKIGDAVRVNVQLIKAGTDSYLWADTFDRKLTDIFSVESEVAKAIADQLRAKLTGQEEQVISAKPTENVEAYDSYLRGLAYTLKPGSNPADYLAAQTYLKEAVRLDPKFALGWALLSYVDARGYLTAVLQPTAALREETREAAETALTLQPNLGEAILAKGLYYRCLKDYDTAVRYFEQARQFLPNRRKIPELLGYVARRRGQWDRNEA